MFSGERGWAVPIPCLRHRSALFPTLLQAGLQRCCSHYHCTPPSLIHPIACHTHAGAAHQAIYQCLTKAGFQPARQDVVSASFREASDGDDDPRLDKVGRW